jgi:hypothetical protein
MKFLADVSWRTREGTDVQTCFIRAVFVCGLPLTRRRRSFLGRNLYPRHNNESDIHTLTTAVGIATTRGQ